MKLIRKYGKHVAFAAFAVCGGYFGRLYLSNSWWLLLWVAIIFAIMWWVFGRDTDDS